MLLTVLSASAMLVLMNWTERCMEVSLQGTRSPPTLQGWLMDVKQARQTSTAVHSDSLNHADGIS